MINVYFLPIGFNFIWNGIDYFILVVSCLKEDVWFYKKRDVKL